MMHATRKMTASRTVARESAHSGIAGWIVMYAVLAGLAMTAMAGANLIGDRFIANLPVITGDPR